MFEWARQTLSENHSPSTVSEIVICDSESIELQPLHCQSQVLAPSQSAPSQLASSLSTSSQSAPVVEADTKMLSSPVVLKTVTAASVYLTGGRHAVATSTGDLVSQHRVSEKDLAELPWQSYRHLKGRSLLLGNSAGAGCYYHWMMDLLPKLGYLQQAGIDLDSIDHFLVREISTEFQKNTLSSLGIDASRITQCADHPYYSCDEVLVLNLEHRISFGMNRFVPNWVNQTFKPNHANASIAGERIKLFISRPKGVRRAIVNEEALIKVLTDEGFTVATMEGLSVQEQAALLARADVLVAAHGGALTNMVFAQAGTQIIELFGSHVYPYYYGLANLCNHHYQAVLQNPADYANLVQLKTAIKSGTAENQNKSQMAGFSVNLDALASCLVAAKAA